MTDYLRMYLSAGLGPLKLFLTMTWKFESERACRARTARLKNVMS